MPERIITTSSTLAGCLLVAGLSEILGLTDEALDNLYRTAAGL